MTFQTTRTLARTSALAILTTAALLTSPVYAAPGPEKADTMMKHDKKDMMKSDAMDKADAMMTSETKDSMMKADAMKSDGMMKADTMKADGMKAHDKADMMMKHADMTSTPAKFQKKTYALKGAVTVEQRGEQTVLVFSDDFRTKKGPDLKVFLSKNAVASATGANATTDAIRLGALTSNKGAQEYVLPAGVSLSDYASVLVHCEAFSKLWGGADIS